MDLKIEPKAVFDAYSTPIVQQTSFWSEVKERLGMHSCAFEYFVRNSDLYDGVGGLCAVWLPCFLSCQHIGPLICMVLLHPACAV